jgi:hypothetical protein
MKTRDLAIGFIVFLGLAGGFAYWLLSPAPTTPVQAAAATTPAAPVAAPTPPPEAKAPRVVMPAAAPVAPPAPVNPTPAPTVAEKPKADPQAQMTTVIPDIVDMLQSGDVFAAYQRYMPPAVLAQMTPEQLSQIEQSMQTPNMQRRIQTATQVFLFLKDQAPAYNDAGDRASYVIPDPTGRGAQIPPVVFQNIDGKWYVDPASMPF